MYQYYGTIIRVVDGDTYDINVDLGFRMFAKKRFRLDGINTPEIFKPQNEVEKKHGKQALAFVKNLIESKKVIIDVIDVGIYQQWKVKITLEDCRDLTTVLKAHNFERLSTY